MSVFTVARARTVARLTLAATMLVGGAAMSPAAHAGRAADKVTITYWNGWTDPVSKSGFNKVIAAFEKAYPNITVHMVDLASDTKLLTAISGGQAPDAATLMNDRNLGAWAARGALQNLDGLAKTYHTNLADYTSAALALSTYRGHLYALIPEVDPTSLLINTDAFKAAGITKYPQTMSELAADALKLTQKDSSGRITQMGLVTGYNSDPLGFTFPIFNVSWYDAQHNKMAIDSPEVMQAVTWEKNLVDKIGVQAYENFRASKAKNAMGDHFIDGTAAMDFDGDWACNLVPAYMTKKFNWVAVAPPYADGHPEWKNSTCVDGSVNVIPTGSQHPNEAYQFINFINTTDANVLLNQYVGGKSPLKSGLAIQHQRGNACSRLFDTLLQGPRAFTWPTLKFSYDLNTGVSNTEDAILRGSVSPKAGLAKLQQQMQAKLDSGQ